jgi:hypothetical protein
MNPISPIASFALLSTGGAAADGVVADVPLWTTATRFALGFEFLWIAGGLALLLWLTRPQRFEQAQPKPTRRATGTRPDDGTPPLAA